MDWATRGPAWDAAGACLIYSTPVRFVSSGGVSGILSSSVLCSLRTKARNSRIYRRRTGGVVARVAPDASHQLSHGGLVLLLFSGWHCLPDLGGHGDHQTMNSLYRYDLRLTEECDSQARERVCGEIPRWK
ncbi:hypothetical protein ElyMa_002455200 [Elysia marginata]|uniref:Uncharacterized protein n=1 Tax=Elysia marginata TaxID=1093978 RepID=A0AAV4GLS6_9GAST|nr:hypothetical protein ElyMa_002455200 [Elysia marginata]